jgi:hypothetical protein
LDADDFTGSEVLVDKTQSAHTNTLILMSRLRPYWEKKELNSKGLESLSLLNREGEKIHCELQIPYDDLSEYLNNRIELGIESFFVAMKKAFDNKLPEEINVLLAGNSSRSERVSNIFTHESSNKRNLVMSELTNALKALTDETDFSQEPENEDLETIYSKIFGETGPKIVIHAPLEADINDESKPTAKTGVALGILRLCPGTEVEVINRASEMSGGEAPFAYYVGKSRRGQFNVGIQRNDSYNEWKEIGVVPKEGIFNFYITQSNHALGNEMEIGHPELYKHSVTFPIQYAGQKVYGMPKSPSSIDIACATEERVKSNDIVAFQEYAFN